MKFAEKWGDSIDIAVDLALQDLKLTRDQVKVTVLEQPSRGFFGFGSKLAKVRVEEIVPEKPAAPAAPAEAEEEAEKIDKRRLVYTNNGGNDDPEEGEAYVEPEREPCERKRRSDKDGGRRGRGRKSGKPAREKQAPRAEEEPDFSFEDLGLMSEKPEDLKEDPENPANQFLADLFREMGLDVSVKVYSGEGCVYAEVEGPDCGTVIGKRGQTLDSVQYLASLVVNKGQSKYIRTIIDAEGYRKKRELTLEKLAVRLAEKAKKSGRSVRLEPMNPYERKVIHSVLQKYEGVSTRSEGKEPYRRVIIEPDK
ncbi:MAG: protein jag [Firmicutes bacterium]|nr:protein jag [Bacillota bacterium]MBQ2059353.1 protein jag [Bacillota bacterium]MBQ4371368.1 protein jag [Bacillota bacterium]